MASFGHSRPAEIEVDFRGEAFSEEKALCRVQTLSSGPELRLGHQIVKEGSGKELAKLRILWR